MSARLAVAILALAAAASAAAYVRSTTDGGRPLAWGVSAVSYHEASAQAFLGPSCAPGDGAVSGPALAAVRASFDAWRVSCSGLDLVDAGPLDEIRTGKAVPGGTYENLVVFRQGWCSNHPAALADPGGCLDDPDVDCGSLYDCFEDHGEDDRRTLALTSVLYFPDTGRIVDADIEVNAWDGTGAGEAITAGSGAPQHGWYFTCAERSGESPRCATYGEAGCYYADLQNTLTHEVGHFVGLRHVCFGGSPDDIDLPACTQAYTQITMYPGTAPGDVAKSTLDADDVAGVCAAYPASDAPGGCGCGAGGAPGALAGALAVLALWPRRRRARAQITSTPA